MLCKRSTSIYLKKCVVHVLCDVFFLIKKYVTILRKKERTDVVCAMILVGTVVYVKHQLLKMLSFIITFQ